MTPSVPLQLTDSTKFPDNFDRWLNAQITLRTDNLLYSHADDLRHMTGISVPSALGIALASLSSAVGPMCRVESPFGATLPASINVLSTDTHRAIGRAVERSLRGCMAALDRLLRLRMSWTEKGRSCETRAAQARFDELQQFITERAAIPRVSPKNNPELAEAITKRDAARRRLGELQFTARPHIFAEQFTAADLPNFIPSSFDRALLLRLRNISALVAEPENVHHVLLAGWHGRVCEIAPGESCSPIISNIWIGVSPGDLSAGFDSPFGSLLATFFIAQSGNGKLKLTRAHDMAAWDDFTASLIQARLASGPSAWTLSSGALEVFEKIVNDLHDLTGGLSQVQRRLTDLWPEQLLKIALLCAQMSPDTGLEASTTIQRPVMEQAATVLRLLGREQLCHHPMLQPAAAKLDPDIAGLAAKLQVHGPMSLRDLSRRYHKRRTVELEQVLARATELGLVRIVNGLVQLLANGMPVSVSARQQPPSADFSNP